MKPFVKNMLSQINRIDLKLDCMFCCLLFFFFFQSCTQHSKKRLLLSSVDICVCMDVYECATLNRLIGVYLSIQLPFLCLIVQFQPVRCSEGKVCTLAGDNLVTLKRQKNRGERLPDSRLPEHPFSHPCSLPCKQLSWSSFKRDVILMQS